MFDPLRAVVVLGAHQVRYVLIGGLAAVTLGSPVVTIDLDICYDRREDNLERLAAALRQLHARLRGDRIPSDLPFRLDAETLRRGDSFTFITDVGPLDVIGTPAGVAGYDELRADAVRVELADVTVWVASTDHLIAMKRASARPKDLEQLRHLEALRAEIDSG